MLIQIVNILQQIESNLLDKQENMLNLALKIKSAKFCVIAVSLPVPFFVRHSIYVKTIASIIASITSRAPILTPHSTPIASGTEKNNQNVVTSEAAPKACVPRILTFRLIK